MLKNSLQYVMSRKLQQNKSISVADLTDESTFLIQKPGQM